MSRPHPAAGPDESLAAVVTQARIDAGYNSVRSFAKDVAPLVGVEMDTARVELTAVEGGRRGVSDRYARAISKLTGLPLTRLRRARPPADSEVIATSLADLAAAVVELTGKVDLLLEAPRDGDSPHE